MLTKIGDVTSKLGISHRSLHYWESAGIVKSSRAENDYRYYDEENLRKVKQIVMLRKLRFSIPSIQEIFTSEKLSKIISIFTNHLDETRKEAEQLNALGVILRQLINMLKDKQDLDSVYHYLSLTHNTESNELKKALQAIMTEPATDILIEPSPELIVDMEGIDLKLEPLTAEDIGMAKKVVSKCYENTTETDKLFENFDFEYQLNIPDCAYCYKIIQSNECVGVVSLTVAGMEAMLIRYLAYGDPDNNIYLFELIRQKHPGILCWNIYFPLNADDKDDFCYDWEGKKLQFADDNRFEVYTDARWKRYIKMLKPHDEVYNSSRYRFALLDGSMDGVSFRFFGADKLDWYDGKMTNWSINECDFSKVLIYDTWMGGSKFYETGIDNSDFRYSIFENSTFYGSSFKNCKMSNCDIDGMTIDGVNVMDALKAYKM